MSHQGTKPTYDVIELSDHNSVYLHSEATVDSELVFPLNLVGIGLPHTVHTNVADFVVTGTDPNLIIVMTHAGARTCMLDEHPVNGMIRTIIDGANAQTHIITIQCSEEHTFINNATEMRLALTGGAMTFFYANNKWYPYKTHKIKPILLQAPFITSPSTNALGQRLTLTLTASPYDAQGGDDAHLASRWQISTDEGFGSMGIVFDSGLTTTNKTSITIPANKLIPNKQYYARVRYQGQTAGWSAWSAIIAFKTAYIAKPTSLLPQGTGNILRPTLTSSSFLVADNGTDTHMSSQWQVLNASDIVVWDSAETTTNKTSITVSTALDLNTTYRARVRHKGTMFGWSEWSNGTLFTTGDKANQPIINIPIGTAEGAGVALRAPLIAQPFSTNYSADSHQSSRWFIYEGSVTIYDSGEVSASTSHTVPAGRLQIGTTYTAAVQYKGNQFGWTEISAPVSFTTGVPVAKPTILAPTGTNIILMPLCRVSDFLGNAVETHYATQWQVSTEPTFQDANQLKVSIESTQYKTTYTVPSSAGLEPSKDYYIRARFRGNEFGYSRWSNEDGIPVTQFTTGARPQQPAITAPMTVDAPLSGTLQASLFQSTSNDTFVEARWSLYTAGGSLILQTTTTSQSCAYSGLVPDTQYKATVAYRGDKFGWSVTSPEYFFRTGKAGQTPTITSPTNTATGQRRQLTLQASPFAANSQGDSYASSFFEISTNSNFSNSSTYYSAVPQQEVANLASNTTYYVRVQHRGSAFGYTQWSPTVSFTTGYVKQPTLAVVPVQGRTDTEGQPLYPKFTVSNFAVVGTDTCKETKIYIYNYATNALVGTTTVSGGATSITSTVKLRSYTRYYAVAQHVGDHFGNSVQTSSGAVFTTGYVYPGEATIGYAWSSPDLSYSGIINHPIWNLRVTAPPIIVGVGTVSKMSVTLKSASGDSFTKEANVSTDSPGIDILFADGLRLKPNTTYTPYIKYYSNEFDGWGPEMQRASFTTGHISINDTLTEYRGGSYRRLSMGWNIRAYTATGTLLGPPRRVFYWKNISVNGTPRASSGWQMTTDEIMSILDNIDYNTTVTVELWVDYNPDSYPSPQMAHIIYTYRIPPPA